MSRDLIDLLEVDHDRIRALKEELRPLFGTGGPASHRDGEKNLAGRVKALQALVTAHSRAEELALYSIFRHVSSKKTEGIHHFSLEGLEEHALIEQALKEVVEARSFDGQIATRFAVASALLDHHLDTEEEEFFPLVREMFGENELAALAEVYARKRDQVLGPQGRQLFAENGGREKRPQI